jgi:DNA phosphorothioation-dependent restriction protein DptG
MIKKLYNIQTEDINKKNSLGNFYPLNSKDNGSQAIFDSKAILGLIISFVSNRKIKDNFDFDEFKKSCRENLKSIVSDVKYIDMVCKIYLDSELYLKLSPLMYQLYNSKDKSKSAFNVIFKPFLVDVTFNLETNHNLNFIEKHIVKIFFNHCQDNKVSNSSIVPSYLEFLSNTFKKDFLFLVESKEYFLDNIDRLIKFYTFIYASQLALNLKPYFLEKPISRELYFILNTEKTSQERKKLVDNSYKTLFEKVGYIFPYLSLLEHLSNITDKEDLRFYQILDLLEESEENIKIIDEFNNKFRERSKLNSKKLDSKSLEESMGNLLNSAYDEFFDPFNSKIGVFNKYKNAYEKQIAKDFIQSRGRFGKVCVLDQEMIIFITNLAIGKERKFLHFEELMKELESRGVYFDYKSKDALLALFERVENIERKSDSGDSVYVYKTV